MLRLQTFTQITIQYVLCEKHATYAHHTVIKPANLPDLPQKQADKCPHLRRSLATILEKYTEFSQLLRTKTRAAPEKIGGGSLQPSAACSNTQYAPLVIGRPYQKRPLATSQYQTAAVASRENAWKCRVFIRFFNLERLLMFPGPRFFPTMASVPLRPLARHSPRFLRSKTHIAATRPQGRDIAPAETRRRTPALPRG